MYVILVYDVNEKRVAKMLKLCRRYLNWIQNSVFEGEITEVKLKELIILAFFTYIVCCIADIVKLKELIILAEEIMNKEEDSLIIFSSRTEKFLDKQIIGLERSSIDNFI